MATPAELDDVAERVESTLSRTRELYARLNGEDRAIFHSFVGELADTLQHLRDLL